MTLRVETDRLRRILSASLPSGVRSAELFVESRISLTLTMAPGSRQIGSSCLDTRIERRWETGAHLRRFAEGRQESFILDRPTLDSLEALALHPEAVAIKWLSGSTPLGISPAETKGEVAPGGVPVEGESPSVEARLSDAAPSAIAGPWSESFLASAYDLILGWHTDLDREAASRRADGIACSSSVGLEASLQEILVISTDRDPARDTRSFADATLSLRLSRSGRSLRSEERLSGARLEDLSRSPGSGSDDPRPPSALFSRACMALEAVASPQGEMPVVFASPSGGFLMHEICGHLLEADHVLRRDSPFVGARGRAISSPLLTMADDGSLRGMRGSMLFDDEGVAARRTPLIMEGTLVGYLSDRVTAFATAGISTGNGRRQSYRDAPMPRMTNLVIDPGSETPEEIVRRTPSGLLVRRVGRGRVEPGTGRFALAIEEGYLIEGGAVGAPVAGGVLRGDAAGLLMAIDAVGADSIADTGAPLCLKEDQALPFGILQPTLRVASMTVARQ